EIVAGVPLLEWLEHLVSTAEKVAPAMASSVLLVEGERLRVGAAPTLPADYNRLVDGIPIGEGYGTCGTAAKRGRTVITKDIETDPYWKNYRDLARRYRLAACWSTPICDRAGTVLGTLALYYREPRQPEPEDIELIEELAALAALAIEYDR